jgi:hypothetical protein
VIGRGGPPREDCAAHDHGDIHSVTVGDRLWVRDARKAQDGKWVELP